MPHLLSIQVGLPRSLGTEGAGDPMDRPWSTGIFKSPVLRPLHLGRTNLAGDAQADLRVHGGPEKAVCVYPAAHYPYWQGELGAPDLAFGAFGENFTVAGLTETEVCIGDVFDVAGAQVQVSQPRQPCWKLARRWRIRDLAVRVQETGYTGWYFRVIREGEVAAGVPLVRRERPFPEWTVARANEVMHVLRRDFDAAAALAACPALAASWRDALEKRVRTRRSASGRNRLVGPNAG